jgi:hypothetical protein
MLKSADPRDTWPTKRKNGSGRRAAVTRQILGQLARTPELAAHQAERVEGALRLEACLGQVEGVGQRERAAVHVQPVFGRGAAGRDEGAAEVEQAPELGVRPLRGLGEPGDLLQGGAQVDDHLGIGETGSGAGRRGDVMACRAFGIAGGGEVDGQLGRDLVGAPVPCNLQPRGDGAVEPSPHRGPKLGLQYLAVEDVPELVARADRAVRPRGHLGRYDQLVPCRDRRADILDVVVGEPEGRGHRGDREVGTNDAGSVEDATLGRREPVELLEHELPEPLGNDARERALEVPAPTRRGKNAALEQVVDRGRHEQRVAAAPGVKLPRDGRIDRLAGEPARQERLHVPCTQRRERDVAGAAMGHERLLHGVERMDAAEDLGRPVAADEEQPCRADALAQIGERVDRGCVAPVNVLEHEDQRAVGRERLERVAELAQQAIAIGVGHPAAAGCPPAGHRPCRASAAPSSAPWRSRIARTVPLASSVQSRPSSSRTGRYGSVAPISSTHRAPAMRVRDVVRVSSTK